jgi:hypothetical protein
MRNRTYAYSDTQRNAYTNSYADAEPNSDRITYPGSGRCGIENYRRR